MPTSTWTNTWVNTNNSSWFSTAYTADDYYDQYLKSKRQKLECEHTYEFLCSTDADEDIYVCTKCKLREHRKQG